jgi:hypothetical protein
MGNSSSSALIKDKQKAKLIFDNFYLFENKNTREKKINPTKKDIDNVLKKSIKYIHSYANLESVTPKGVKIKIIKTDYNKKNNQLICNIIFHINKNTSISENEYKKYIEDKSNGPFENIWTDSPANIEVPVIEY